MNLLICLIKNPNIVDKVIWYYSALLKPLFFISDETSRGENWTQGSFIHCNRGMSLLVTLFVGSPDYEFIGTLIEDVSTEC